MGISCVFSFAALNIKTKDDLCTSFLDMTKLGLGPYLTLGFVTELPLGRHFVWEELVLVDEWRRRSFSCGLRMLLSPVATWVIDHGLWRGDRAILGRKILLLTFHVWARQAIDSGGGRVVARAGPHPYLCVATWTYLWPSYYLYINNTDYPPIIQEASHSGGGFTACRGHSAPSATST